ncbi:MAG: fumarylacetoacetate hydrolase family protein [Steroidobacteraceae bacterium]
MKLYGTPDGIAVNAGDRWFHAREVSFDRLFAEDRPLAWLRPRLEACARPEVAGALPAPLGRQEVWAAGVTFQRSRAARMAESGREADVYARIYDAERPELFFKATPHRVAGHGGEVRIRSDSAWNVPEAELALAVNRAGRIFGYTIGNDMSSRSIEGENPLYLPQAKIHDGCCALGPCLLLSEQPLAPSTEISLGIERDGREVFRGATRLSRMRRSPDELVAWLFRDNSFPDGCYLLTGTGIVPDAGFTLAPGDVVAITIEPIGTLRNRVTVRPAR